MYSSHHSFRIVLADASAIVRAGIKRLLADTPEIEVVNECSDAQSAVAALAERHADLVLMDFRLSSGTAVDVLRHCRSMKTRPIAIVYTLQIDASTRAISYAAGADVFYEKTKDMDPLLNMIRKLATALVHNESIAAAA